MTQRPTFMDVPYCDMPYPQHQPSPTNCDPTFEERIQQALGGIEFKNQLNNQILQSLKELETQTRQREEEEGELPSQLESDPEGQYLARNFNILITFIEQLIMTLENELIIE